MIDTLIALTLAHVVADFMLQTNWMVREKRTFPAMAAHIAVVGITALIALGGSITLVLSVMAAHLIIDLIKTHVLPEGVESFLADQAAHILSLFGLSLIFPEAASLGVWAGFLAELSGPAVLFTGWVITAQMGGYAIGFFMTRFSEGGLPEGLPNAGRAIGLLERSLIFLMVLIGEPTGVGFLIAAKSVLRFDTASKDQKASEYVIIGTLASFGWAMASAYVTVYVLSILTP